MRGRAALLTVLAFFAVGLLTAPTGAQGPFELQRAAGQYLACQSNLKNIGTALEMWSFDHKGKYPARLSEVTPDCLRSIPTCPAARLDTYSAAFRVNSNRGAYAVNCYGSYHAALGIPANCPTYDSNAGLTAPKGTYEAPRSSQSQVVSCQSNLKNIGTALEMWSVDHSGRYPTSLKRVTPDYLKTIPTCPAAGRDTYTASFKSMSNPDWYQVFCQGNNHATAGYGPSQPAYDSRRGLTP